jgi:hypothetical protein
MLKELLEKKKHQSLTDSEKFSIEKYFYIQKFNLHENTITFDIFNKIYGMTHIIDNYNLLMSNNIDNFNDIVDLSEEIKFKRLKWIQTIISNLGFNLISSSNIKITTDEFNDNKISLIGKLSNDFGLIFNLKKNNMIYFNELLNGYVDKKSNNKKFIGFINSLLYCYGVKIECVNKVIKVNNVVKTTYPYHLTEIDIINIYIGYKYK